MVLKLLKNGDVMKCNNCGSEWSANASYSQIRNCPFCGCSLIKRISPDVDLELSSVIKQIIAQFGEEIILQKQKFISIFGDLAPQLKKEKKILSVAMDEDIAAMFLNCAPEDRNAHIVSSKRKLDGILSESAVEMIIIAFSDAFSWNIDMKFEPNSSSSYSNTESWSFNTPDEMLSLAKKLINGNLDYFDFDTQRYSDESTDSEYQHACRELNQEHFKEAFDIFIKLLYPNPKDRSKIGSVLAGVKLAQIYYFGDGVRKSQETAAHILFSLVPYKNPLVIAWISELYRIAIPGLTEKDHLLSREIYQRCASNLNIMAYLGDADAAYFIGFNLTSGINCDKDEKQGFSYLHNSAESGNIRAKVELALCYMDGIGIATDVKRGISILLNLSNSENAKAQYRLGLVYYLDKYKSYIEHDESIALQHFLIAAKAGHKSAQDYVGDFYYFGNSVSVDYKKAKYWYDLAASMGNVHATSQLGAIYFFGYGVDEDLDQAFRYFKLAADKGNTFSQYMLHHFYFPDGKYKDYETGRRYLEMAAESGDVDAQKLLSRMYISDLGFNDDYKFVYWMKKAAEQGDAEAERIYGEAILHFDNDQVLPKDYGEAHKWLSQAATQGDVDAMVDLSELWSMGGDVPPSADFAYTFAVGAINILKTRFNQETGNVEETMKLLKRVAQALTSTGKLYERESNSEKSFECYQIAVTIEENGERCRLLGMCYKNGNGVKKDKKKAKDLLKKAASLGDNIAKNELSKLFF